MRFIWFALVLLTPWAASARILDVGPTQQYKQPSEAIAAASNGDTIRIATGQYFDCAIVRQNNLIIQGSGQAIMTDKACAGKGLLVIDGNNVLVQNLTLQRARVPDQNGAGIRAEGGDLMIDNVTFINDENGILGADNPSATMHVLNSHFIGDGKCAGACGHALYVGHIKLLHVENTQFFDTHEGHSIKSRALRTEVMNSDIQDGPNGTSSYLIEAPNGGSLIVEHNKMEKGKNSQNKANTIMIGSEGVSQPTDEISVRNNTFTNDLGRSTTFVTNLTATSATVTGNSFKGDVRPLQGDGKID